ncbi:sensor histidine kinase [Acidipropionibacterium jensenii]|uniref:sensor histidine kinase n=1 Tax=Acidipropionibacterium jensenii TaxID=1749 RepID=UPI000BC2EAD7|nr:HAMP domain-containing sensor histidine kinase [Acidipropionibacterium jensenii]AZZ42383.1 sensor histidine kinase [Acidipropionibacterium jensenii]
MTRQISLATVGVSLLFVAAVIATVSFQSRPAELNEPARPGEVRIHLAASKVVGISVGVAVLAVCYALVISWVVSRRAIRPLAQALELQRRFVADASHELRTPLAVLDARVQMLQRQLTEGETAVETVTSLREDTGRLIGIVNDLLAILGDDPGEDARGPGPISDASAIVTSNVESLRVLAEQKGVSLVTAVEPGLQVRMPPSGLGRCVTALVDNAINHCPNGSRVRVGLERSGARALMTVADDGPGIRGIAPQRVFDRFAHTEPADHLGVRNGFGIGLALVQELVTRSSGEVRVASTGPDGTVMELTVPLTQ